MEIIDLKANSVALSTSYMGDADLNFISVKDVTQEGYTFYRENYLNGAEDRKINNYSSLYLTKKKKATDFLNLTRLSDSDANVSFSTSLIDINGMYFTFSSINPIRATYTLTAKDQKFVDPTDRIFEVILISGGMTCIIRHRSKERIYFYLNNNNGSLEFTVYPDLETSIFNYALDAVNNKMSLFQDSKLLVSSNNTLVFDDNIEKFDTNYFTVNYYIQHLEPKLNTSWVSYDERYKNSYEIVSEKSRSDLENNYIISTEYSYITGDVISANILTLKNQKTNKNYSYRSDYLETRNDNVPVVDNRTYNSIFTGNDQETGDYGITLNYEFYNADYKMKKDEYTIFYTPDSLYPYEQININDLKWNVRGAIAGENPYYSDKIFQKQDNINGVPGRYLCSWLHKDRDGNSTWLDRYFYPEKTTYASALSTSFNFTYTDPINNLLHSKLSASEYYDVPDIYNSLYEEYNHTPQTDQYALYGISFFDKRSDVCIKPNSEYIYQRIGDAYVKTVLSTIENFLIQNGLTAKNSDGNTILVETQPDETNYSFDGNTYASIDDYNKINNSHQFTISFWMQSDDWSSGFGHQIFGNLNQKGIGLLDDEKITPFIMIQNNKKVFTFNTNFEFLDVASLDNETLVNNPNIKDIYRTDHLDSFYTINID